MRYSKEIVNQIKIIDDVLYYYIYLFYAKVMPDDYSHSNTVWALGFLFF